MINTTILDLNKTSSRARAFLYNTLIVIGASLVMALLAQVRIPVAFSPVPITGQTFGVLMIGALLGSKRGALAMLAYLLEGASGLPVFAGGGFGLAYLTGPTGGYLMGFVVGAFVCGLLVEKGWSEHFLPTLAAMFITTAVIFYFGLTWLMLFVGGKNVLQLGLIPFIPGAVLKAFIATAVLPLGWKLLGRNE